MRISDWSSDVCSSDLQLSREHAVDRERAKCVIAVLRPLIGGRSPNSEQQVSALTRAFAEAQRRHVAWEEAILYPLARARLNAPSLRDLSRRLARRRRWWYLTTFDTGTRKRVR